MSKLIVEMEMPRNCDECVVGFGCAFCGITGSAFYGNTRIPNFMPDEMLLFLISMTGRYMDIQKLPDCPIKGVLPEEHGDLVDADAIYERAGQKKGEADPLALVREFWNAPVIIAAERKDDEQIH